MEASATTRLPQFGSRLQPLAGSRLVIPALVVVLGLLAGAIVWLGVTYPHPTLIGIMALICAFPFVLRIAQNRWDPFEPIILLAFGIFVLFVLRPLGELVYDIQTFGHGAAQAGPNLLIGDFPLRGGFTWAMVVAIVGTMALYAGYFSGLGGRIAGRLKPLPGTWDTDRSVRFCIGMLILAALFTVGFMSTLGGPGTLFKFYLGRTQFDASQALATSGYVSFGNQLVIPAAIILLLAAMKKRTLGVWILFGIALAATIFITVPRGDRTYVIAWALPLLVLWYLRRGKRPSGLAIVGAIVFAVMALNVMLALRHQETRAQVGVVNTIVGALTSPLAQMEDFITGIDLGEFSVLEVQMQAHRSDTWHLDYHPGATITSTLIQPFPRRIIKNKPQPGLVHVSEHLFPNNPRRASFGPSMFGDLFADYGWWTLIGFCFLIGVGVRSIWDYFLRHASNPGMQIFFAASLPLLVIMTRNALTDVISRSFFLVLPIIICLIVCSRPAPRILAGYRSRPSSSGPSPASSASP